MSNLRQIDGFDWDDGNIRKSADKHSVSQAESEQIFADNQVLLVDDVRHSQHEERYQAVGRTVDGRLLHVTFTVRGRKIRVISARNINGKNESSMTKKLKSIPHFRNEAEERRFWETHDSTDYVDWSQAQRVQFPNLKLSTKAISLRLPLGVLDRIKVAANKRDVPYQSLIKVWLAEKLDAE